MRAGEQLSVAKKERQRMREVTSDVEALKVSLQRSVCHFFLKARLSCFWDVPYREMCTIIIKNKSKEVY